MTTSKILTELQSLGRESYKKVMLNHGVEEPIFGVKIEELKKIVKREKPNHALALELYATGNYDAMYLAGLLADDSQMSQQELQHWVENTKGTAIAGVIVPWVAAGSSHGWEMGLRWIESASPTIAGAGCSPARSIRLATITLVNAITAPTERSIPPDRITKVAPAAATPRNALSTRRLRSTAQEAKFGNDSAPMRNATTSTVAVAVSGIERPDSRKVMPFPSRSIRPDTG